MTYFLFILCVLCLDICNVQGKVDLKKGQIERVSFDGDELKIVVDNSAGNYGRFQICFASLPDLSFPACPSGFTGAIVSMEGYVKREFTLNRQGRLLFGKEGLGMGTVVFNEDSTLNVTVVEVPDTRSIVTLENAQIFEFQAPAEEKSAKRISKEAIIGIVVGVIGLILLLLGIGATVGIYLYRRNKNKKPVPPPEIAVQAPKVAETPNPSPATNDKKEERPATPKTSQPKPKSPQAPATPPPTPKAVPDPEPKPLTPLPVQPPATPPQATVPEPTPPSTKPVEPLPKKVEKAENEKKAETPKTMPTVKTTEPTKEASIEPPEKPIGKQEKTKTADKTVAEKPPSPPTPKFSDHAFSRNVAANSNLREKDNLEFEETAGPLAKKIDYADIDELARFELLTESIPCYGLRNGKFTRHDNFILRERFSTRPHTVHVEEKEIMKGTPSDAVDAANVLVERIERELRGFGYRPELGLIQKSDLWEHLDLEDTEMSKLYWLLLQMKPDLFKVEKQEIKTVEVQIMPIAMLYALILDTRLKRSFREELVTELRTSTLDVIRLASQDSLRLCAFPLNYLVLLHNKNPARYVGGRKALKE